MENRSSWPHCAKNGLTASTLTFSHHPHFLHPRSLTSSTGPTQPVSPSTSSRVPWPCNIAKRPLIVFFLKKKTMSVLCCATVWCTLGFRDGELPLSMPTLLTYSPSYLLAQQAKCPRVATQDRYLLLVVVLAILCWCLVDAA